MSYLIEKAMKRREGVVFIIFFSTNFMIYIRDYHDVHQFNHPFRQVIMFKFAIFLRDTSAMLS